MENINKITAKFYRVSVKALILDENKKFLLILENDAWELPGGGLRFGEAPKDCLIREIREEMNLEVECIKSQPSYFITAPHRSGQYWICNAIYEVKVKSLAFVASEECSAIKFFNKEEALKEKLFSNVEVFVKSYIPEMP
jgi:8-oxo-dGTP diphosphatase